MDRCRTTPSASAWSGTASGTPSRASRTQGWIAEDRDPVQDAAVQAGPDDLGVQRRAADQAAVRKSIAGPRRGRTSGSATWPKPAVSKDSKASSRDAASTSGRMPPSPRTAATAESAAGVDVFKNLTPSLSAAITVNTDFAETEADLRQVNLTRFPLFFPEKRAFFLEGAGVFDVAGLVNTTDIRPFFSRRIGLLEDLAVPIRVGAKLTGRQGHYNVGVLDVETGALSDPALTGGSVSRQNLLTARVSRNIFQQSWIGGIVTHGNPTGAGDNTLIGGDARFATSTFRGNKNLSLDLYLLATDDGETRSRAGAGGFKLDYPNDRWDVALNFKQIGERFRPALGFVPRAGIRKTDLSIAFQPRPDRWGIRQFFFELNPTVVTNLGNEVETWSVFTAPFNLRTESGEHLEWNYIPAVRASGRCPSRSAPASSFRQDRTDGRDTAPRSNTATKRPWVVDAAWWWGGFYGGTLRQLELGVTLKPNTHVALSAQAERNDVTLPQGRFYTEILTIRADYNFTPNVSWANLTQYDNESRIAGWQSRFRWILRPGNDLFLVVNRGWYRTLDDRSIRAALRSRVGEATIHLQILMTAFRIGFAAWALLTASLFAGREPTAPIGQTGTPAAPGASAAYVGSAACERCHAPIYHRWKRTRMANVVRDPREHPDAIIPDLSKPDPLRHVHEGRRRVRLRQQVEAALFHEGRRRLLPAAGAVGRHHKVMAPVLRRDGHRLVDPFYPPDNSKRPTGPLCDGCHSVNYDVRTKAVTEWNVGCEKCHGPGSDHVARPTRAQHRQPGAARSVARRTTCASSAIRRAGRRQPDRGPLLRLAGRVPRGTAT